MNTRKKLIVLTASACAVISAGLGVSTVAWFTANREATFSYQNIRAHATIGDLIIDYTEKVNASPAAVDTGYDIEVGLVDTLVTDLSGKDGYSLLKPTWEGNKATYGAPGNTDYVQFELALTNTGADKVGLYFNGDSDTIGGPLGAFEDGSDQIRMHVDASATTEHFVGNGTNKEFALGATATKLQSIKVAGEEKIVVVENEEITVPSGEKVKAFTLAHAGLDIISISFDGKAYAGSVDGTGLTLDGNGIAESDGTKKLSVSYRYLDGVSFASNKLTFEAAPANEAAVVVRYSFDEGKEYLLSENGDAKQYYIDENVNYARYSATRGVTYYGTEAKQLDAETVGTGNGSLKTFKLAHTIAKNTTPTVSVGGDAVTEFTVSTNRRDESSITFAEAPAEGKEIKVTYKTSETDLSETSVVNPATLAYSSTNTSASDNYLGDLAKNQEINVTVTVWFEGTYQDENGKNDVQNAYNDYGWSLFLDFVTGAAA